MPYSIVDYISRYYGPIMHVDTTQFAIAVGNGDTAEIETEYDNLCSTIKKDHGYHHEEINKNFNRMRVEVNVSFSGKDTKPPNLPYVFFGIE